VNGLRLPFYSGAIFLLVMMTMGFLFLLKRLPRYRTYTWSVIFLLLGFLPYLMLFIRSNHNPPIDETNPEDLAMIKAYMNRESYPTAPLLTGPYFDAQITDVFNSGKAYYKTKEEYKVAGSLINYSYEKNRTTFLPRMYSRDAAQVDAYRQWAGLKPDEKPNFKDNLNFMFSYQLGHMYLRYFLWNFSGRESDIQDSPWLKPWDPLAHESDSKARNQYWMIPLLLGICGAIVQFRADKRSFFGNAIFFLITGLVLAVYLNSPPIEPRERDYIYVASYIAFCIWVGLGVLMLRQSFLSDNVQKGLVIAVTLFVPCWMFYQNVDDHDRSGRTFQMDHARAVLSSCYPGAVLFTGGDNDTFPLWYLQEVEGFRTDVRVVVLSYFNTDWYINQLRKSYYDSKPFKLTLTEKDYRQYGTNDVLYVEERIKDPVDVRQFLQLLTDEHPALKRYTNRGDSYNIIPSRQLTIAIDHNKASLFQRTALTKATEVNLNVTDNYLQKNALAILDLIASNNWERPVYFNFTSLNTLGLDIRAYVVDEGLVYRLTQVENQEEHIRVDTEQAYKNLVINGNFSNLGRHDVFFNHEDYHLRMITPLRQAFNTLAAACLEKGDTTMARSVLNKSFGNLFHSYLSSSYADINAAEMLHALHDDKKAKVIAIAYFQRRFPEMARQLQSQKQPDRTELYFLTRACNLLEQMGEPKYMNSMRVLYP
jgi:Ca2+/Na+ antiporter